MGEIINVRCKACKREWRCLTGCGLLHGRKEAVLAAFSVEERPFVESMLAVEEIPVYDFGYRLAVCGHCRNVTAVPVLTLLDRDETYVGRCPSCGEKTQEPCPEEGSVEKWSEETACPFCNSRKLEVGEVGSWD